MITSPQSNETLRENSGSVTVSVAVDPQLNIPAGDRVQIQLDGQIIKKEPQQLSITLKQLDRGAHTLSAAVVNKAGQPLLQAQPVTFFLHRTIRR